MTLLVTGCAGFIGYHTCKKLLDQDYKIIGIDNLNDYYCVDLKKSRLKQIIDHPNFTFYQKNIADRKAIFSIFKNHNEIEQIIHLAAQAGVRYSLKNPYSYVETNVMGQVVLLEASRQLKKLKRFIYASSSSVYGANKAIPFSTQDRTDSPISLYAATKKSTELISYTYTHLFQIPTIGLRFFTVYGPWGRPDMAPILFTKALFNDEELSVFNNGKMKRDFTYIDDIIHGIIACTKDNQSNTSLHKIYNLGNNQSEHLMDFIKTLEVSTGKKANLNFMPMQPGDVEETYADISTANKDLGYSPKTKISTGIPIFVEWYKDYYKVQ